MKINKYPDNTSYVNNTKLGKQVFRINNYEDLWHLNQFVDAFHSQHDSITYKIRPNIIIPNLIDAQADRRFNKGESFGLKLVLQKLVKMDADFSIFHPHNPEVIEMAFEMYNKKVETIDNSEFIKTVFYKLTETGVSSVEWGKDLTDSLVLMSSDAGGFKPLMKLCDKIEWCGEVASASKARSYESGKTTLHQIVPIKDFNGKDILIIDDICVYGGTFKGLSKLLKERNCGKLFLAVSHMTVENLGEDPVTNYFDKVFTTNSKYNEYAYKIGSFPDTVEIRTPKNLEIIKLF